MPITVAHLTGILAGFHLPAHPYPTVLTTAVLLLITSEGTSFYPGSAAFKIAASLAFFLAGIKSATSSPNSIDLFSYESLTLPSRRSVILLLLGLLFSVIGDVLLIPSPEVYHQKTPSKNKNSEGDTPRFKAGVFFFALAHIAYTGAFLAGAGSAGMRWFAFFTTLKVGFALTYFLGLLARNPPPGSRFAVPADMRGLVAGYVVIIWTMVATATATDVGYQRIASGWIFMISDLFVAADVVGRRLRHGLERGADLGGRRGQLGG